MTRTYDSMGDFVENGVDDFCLGIQLYVSPRQADITRGSFGGIFAPAERANGIHPFEFPCR